MKINRYFSLENLFFFITLVSGLFFAFFVPPNQVPDEGAHVSTVYGIILEGKLSSKYSNLPIQLESILGEYYRADKQEAKINITNYFSNYSLKSNHVTGQSNHRTNYSPTLYLPQLIGVGIGMLLGLSDMVVFTMGRIFSLLVYIGIGYILLKTTPVAKMSLFVLLAMPMSVYLAASYSADTSQNLLSFFYMVMVVVGLNSPGKLSKKEVVMFLGGSVLLGLSKPISLLIILLSFAIPVTRFENRRQKMIFALGQLGLGLIFAFLWSRFTSGDAPPYSFSYIEPAKQLLYIILNPISYIKVILATLSKYSEGWFYGFVGIFGWLTIQMPDFVYFLFLVSVSLAMIVDLKKPLVMTREQRTIFLGIFVIYFVGLITSMYLFWNPVGYSVATGVQGRYFIPILPLLLYLVVSLKREGKSPFGWAAQAAQVAVVSLVPVVMFFAIQTIYLKYYVPCGELFYDKTGFCMLPNGLPTDIPIGEITKPVTQTFTVDCNDIIGVDLFFATYQRQNSGSLNVSLRDETSNVLVFERDINVAELNDNEWKLFRFPLIQNVSSNKFALTLTPRGSAPGNAITVWSTASDIYTQGELIGVEGNGDLVFRYVCPFGIVNEILNVDHNK